LDVGTPVRGGGDSDIFRRILAAGYRIIYDPDALNWHRHMRAWKGLRRQVNGYESADFAVWARSLLMEGELEALAQSGNWLRRELPALVSALLQKPGSAPPDLAIVRLLRCSRALGLPLRPLKLRRKGHCERRRPAISVIIPTHNRRADLERMLEALKVQHFLGGSRGYYCIRWFSGWNTGYVEGLQSAF
jgi:hypothetical protein